MFAGDESWDNYFPRAAPLFRPARIVLAKGSHRTQARRQLAERICEVCPETEVIEAFETPHNRIDLGTANPLWLHERGKRTLVLGEVANADILLVAQATSRGKNARLGWFRTARQGTYDAQRLLSEPPCLQIRLITRDWLG